MSADLAGADLRRRTLVGAHLAGAHLRGADLRGADLGGANLRGADLSGIRAGMGPRWQAVVALAALVVSIGVGALSGLLGGFLWRLITSDEPRRQMIGGFVVAVLLVFLGAGIWRGLGVAIRSVLPVTASVAVAGGVVFIVAGVGTGVGALTVLVFLLLAVLIVLLSVFARAVAGAVGALAFVVVAISGALVGGWLGGGQVAFAVALGAMLIARRSSAREAIHPRLTRGLAKLACRGGTHFRDADLTDARFDDAQLTACDFRGARLEGADLERAQTHLCLFDAPS